MGVTRFGDLQRASRPGAIRRLTHLAIRSTMHCTVNKQQPARIDCLVAYNIPRLNAAGSISYISSDEGVCSAIYIPYFVRRRRLLGNDTIKLSISKFIS